MLGEIRRRPEVRRSMQAVDESFDDGLRQQLEIPDPRENARDRGTTVAVSATAATAVIRSTCPTSAAARRASSFSMI